MTNAHPVVYVVGFGAPPVLQLDECLALVRDRGWDTYVILSPTAASWVDVDHLAKVSGHPVRVAPRTPLEPDPLPSADAIIAAPLTFNSLSKWSVGISDTLALGLLNESVGLPIPVVAAPCIKQTLRRHPAYSIHVQQLADAGVHYLQPDSVSVRPPARMTEFNWSLVVAEAERTWSATRDAGNE